MKDNDCGHTDGYIVEEVVINLEQENDNMEATATCNRLGCNNKITIKFDIINLERIYTN